MSDKARELLERLVATNNCTCGECRRVWEETRSFLAQPEVSKEELKSILDNAPKGEVNVSVDGFPTMWIGGGK